MKTVIEMAREAAAIHGHTFKAVPSPETIEFITAFAELVRADEREACAQSLDKQADLACDAFDRQWAQEMAAAVRARWNT
jgi:hypothetical protein